MPEAKHSAAGRIAESPANRMNCSPWLNPSRISTSFTTVARDPKRRQPREREPCCLARLHRVLLMAMRMMPVMTPMMVMTMVFMPGGDNNRGVRRGLERRRKIKAREGEEQKGYQSFHCNIELSSKRF